MGWITEVLIGAVELAELVVIGIAVALLFRGAWAVLGSWVPNALRPVFRAVERRTVMAFGPLPQSLLCVLTVVLTVLALRTPGDGPWSSIMGEDHQDGLSTAMLAGATALLILLTFTASRAKSAEEAAEGGEKYMGRVLPTYRFLHSPWTRLTRQRAFQTLVVALFALPVLLTALPAGAQTPFRIPQVGAALPLDDLFAALWCASFALVGSVLILHLVSSLRIAPLETPLVQKLIRWDLADESSAEWRELLRGGTRKDSPPRLFHEWAQGHFSTARTLPVAELEGYLLATVLHRQLLGISERLLDRAVRRLEKAARAAQTLHTNDADTRALEVWQEISAEVRVRRRRRRAEREVAVFEAAHSALLSVCIAALATPGTDASTGDDVASLPRLLSRRVIDAGKRIDDAHSRLLDVGATELAHSLLTPSGSLPERSVLRARMWHGRNATPEVLTLTATGFRDLARAVYDAPVRTAPRVGTGIPLADLMDSAREVRHRATRDYILGELVTCYLRGVVIKGSSVESPEALKDVQQRYRRDPAGGSAPERGSSVAELIGKRAFVELTHHGDLDPSARGHLLSLLAGWQAPCALLHALLYARRSGRELPAAQLAPYAEAISHLTPFTPDALDELRSNAVRIIRDPSYNTSHFTRDEGVEWLVEVLGQRLTTDLCLDFARRRDAFQILELRLLDFVQWHVIAGEGLAGPTAQGNDADLSTVEGGSSAASLWSFARKWSAIRPVEGRALLLWLRFAVGPEPRHETSTGYTWAVRNRLAGTDTW